MAIKRIVLPVLFALLFTGCATTINFEATDQALFSKAIDSTISKFDIPNAFIASKKINLRVVGFRSTNSELKELKPEGAVNPITWEATLLEDKIVEYLRKSAVSITASEKSDYELVIMSEVAGMHITQKDVLISNYRERGAKVKLHVYLFDKIHGNIIFSCNYSGSSFIEQ